MSGVRIGTVRPYEPKDDMTVEKTDDGRIIVTLNFSIELVLMTHVEGGIPIVELEPAFAIPYSPDLQSVKQFTGQVSYKGHFGDPMHLRIVTQKMVRTVHVTADGHWYFAEKE